MPDCLNSRCVKKTGGTKLVFWLLAALLFTVFLVLILFNAGGGSASAEVPLVLVQVDNKEDLQIFKDSGLELLQTDQVRGEVILALDSQGQDFLQNCGYEYEVMVQDINRKSSTQVYLQGGERPFPNAAERDDYRTWDDYLDEIFAIEALYPDITKLHIVGYSHWGLPMYTLEICDAPGVNDGRPESFHEAQMHAQEWPSGEAAMELAWYLVENYGSDEQVDDIIENIRTFIMPVTNPDGVIYKHVVGGYWRKNRLDMGDGNFGVDLNRNFSYGWGASGSADPAERRDYRGPAPYSEPETQAWGDFMLSREIITTIRGHTYLEIFFHPDIAEEDQDVYWGIIDQMTAWNNYGTREGQAGGSNSHHCYHLLRGFGVTIEYQKRAIPPYQGYAAPGLDTDAFGMLKGNLVWDSVPVSDPWPVYGVEAQLINCGDGLSPADYPAEVAGNLALIRQEEDEYIFDDQFELAQNAGAAGVVFYNTTDGFVRVPNLRNVNVNIPVMVLQGQDGEQLADYLDGGQPINARMAPAAFTQDSTWECWERNKKPILYAIEQAAVIAAVIEGSVTGRLDGEPLPARLDKEVVLTAPFGGAYEGGYMEHIHHSYIETDGSYRWHVLPSKQPFLDTPPYDITATACGHYPQTAFLAVDHFGEEHRLDFTLQPVLELQGECAYRSRWPVNSMVQFNFITVDPRGRPADMENVTVRLFSGDTEIATFVEGNGPEDIEKGADPGVYFLNFSTVGFDTGIYEAVVEFSGEEEEQFYRTELVVAEELVLEGPELMIIPAAGQAEETYFAFQIDEWGSMVPVVGITWSLEQPVAGVTVDSTTGLVTVESGAGAGSFTLIAEAGGVTGTKEVTLAGSELAAAITAAAEAIADLPGAVVLEDAAQVEGARALVDDVLALGGEESRIPHILKLISAENKLAGLERIAAIINEAVTLAEDAIADLPETITLADRDAVKEARALAGRAFILGAAEADIQNMDLLVAAEAEIEGIIEGLIIAAEEAIAGLPAEVTLDDEPAVKEARQLVEAALDAGLEESAINNLDLLLAAEEAIEDLYERYFVRQSLFELGEPEAEEGMHRFTDYYGSWTLDRTIGGVSFAPLRMFTVSHIMTTIGTPDNPRWAEYDISGRGYEFVEGYVGTTDDTPRSDYPYDFQIYVDGHLAYHTLMVMGDPIFYRIDIAGAEKIKFVFWAEETVESGYANRPGIVEPRFLIPITQEVLDAIAAAEDAIEAIPAPVSLLDEETVHNARELADQVLALGVEEGSIANLEKLLTAEEDILSYYQDIYTAESLFVLGDPGPENENGMDRFLDYENPERWRLDRTIAGVSFAPLKLFSGSYNMTNVGTPENPRWIEYDISGRGYDFVEGYVGTAEPTPRTNCPNTFAIHVDGEPVFQVVGEAGEVFHYRLDLQGAEKIKFIYWAVDTSDTGFANRPGIVEPMFYITDIEAAVAAAEGAIDALPAEISPAAREEIEAARVLVNNALAIGAQPAEMGNLDELEAAEAALAGMEDMIEGISAAMSAIADLPAELTLQDEPLVREARQLIDRALALGAGESDIENLHIFEGAWSAVEALIQELFQAESLFELGDPGPANYQGMENFVDYTDPEYWRLDRTIGGASFSPLKIFTSSEDMSDLGTPGNPRRVAYDISGRDYAFMEGYAGITDQSLESDYPLNFAILAGGEPVFEAVLAPGPAMFYRVDLWDVEQVEFRYWAEETAPSGHANCPGFVEPRFFTAQIDAAIAAAEYAISELPAEITPQERQQVEAARRQVDNALVIGVQPGEIGNLSELEDAEAVLAEWAAREGTMQYALDLALTKIDGLPEKISMEDMYSVFEARALADRALRSGAVPMLVTNLGELEEAEAALHQLMDICFTKESLHELTPVDWQDGSLSEMSGRFANYHDTGSWNYDYTVYNRTYYSLKVYSRGHIDLNVQPQWIDYDISGKGYEYMEGYVGIWDESSAVSYPPTFRIYGEIDGRLEILFEVEELWRGEPPYHYFLDLTGVDRIRFYMESEVVSPNRWTNRIAIVEPQFLTAVDLSEIIALAEAAIAALPAPGDITSEDEAAVLEARSLVDSAFAMGAVEEDIANYDLLLAAEAALVDLPEVLYGDINGDGVINVEDVIMVMQSVLGLIQLDEPQQQAADVNGDETINVDDVILIMQRVLGLITQFPVEN